jgi:hypothetical protein
MKIERLIPSGLSDDAAGQIGIGKPDLGPSTQYFADYRVIGDEPRYACDHIRGQEI